MKPQNSIAWLQCIPCVALKVMVWAHGLAVGAICGSIGWPGWNYRFFIQAHKSIGWLQWIPGGALKVQVLAHCLAVGARCGSIGLPGWKYKFL